MRQEEEMLESRLTIAVDDPYSSAAEAAYTGLCGVVRFSLNQPQR
jgi:hypothetical protein